MTINNIDIESTLKDVEKLLREDEQSSPAMKSMVSVLVMVVKLLTNRIGLNSHNSSKPPSTDWGGNNQKKDQSENKSQSNNESTNKRKSGGQPGHVGTTLKQVEEPDIIESILVDCATLPKGDYEDGGIEARQVVDIEILRHVTEYQAQVLINKKTGERHVAPFPEGVTKAVQYGNKLKAHVVYMSQYQLLPYKRVQEFFTDQMGIPISEGSIYNFSLSAYSKLERFETITKQQLIESPLLHVDETGININGDSRHWLHCATNASWTYFFAHKNRGNDATEPEGILPAFKGVLCHDHWKPYYHYTNCLHALCNAHHLRELIRAWEQDEQRWAETLHTFLVAVNKEVHEAGGKLDDECSQKRWKEYKEILKDAEKECPPPDEADRPAGKRGRLKRSKSRNLLERFINYEEDVMRFMDNEIVPFTNNQGERDIRMTKVHQKISGCFRSIKGAEMFCRIRGYLSTCRKQGVGSSEAMELLFNDELPLFAQ